MNWHIGWHCRGCNKYAIEDIPFETIIKARKKGESVLVVVERVIKHECPNRDLGIKILAKTENKE